MAPRVVPTAFPTDPQLTTPDEFGAAVRAARTASGLTLEVDEAMTEERHSALVRQLFESALRSSAADAASCSVRRRHRPSRHR